MKGYVKLDPKDVLKACDNHDKCWDYTVSCKLELEDKLRNTEVKIFGFFKTNKFNALGNDALSRYFALQRLLTVEYPKAISYDRFGCMDKIRATAEKASARGDEILADEELVKFVSDWENWSE